MCATHRMVHVHRMHLDRFTPTYHRNHPQKPDTCGFPLDYRHGVLSSSRFGTRVFCEALAGGIGNGIYGNRIFCFSQPNTNFSSVMWLSLPRYICFLVLPPLVFHEPVGMVPTIYVDPTIQLLLRR